MLNTLKILSLNYLNDIAIYDYKKTLYINNNYYINNLLNNDLNYYYVFIIDYSNKQINIDIYNNNKKTIFYNICYDLYYNKDAFNLFDAILNKDNYNFNYSIIKINK